jgi:cation transport ATPase
VPNETHKRSTGPSIARVKLAVSNLYCVCCADELERVLRANPYVVNTRVDYLAEQVEVSFDPGMLDEAEIQHLINESRRCSCGPATTKDETTHLHHRAQMASINMGTKHDRMQYELPARARSGRTKWPIRKPRVMPGWTTTCPIQRWLKRWSWTCGTASAWLSP